MRVPGGVNSAASVDQAGPPTRIGAVEYEVKVEREQRLKARAEQSVDRFVGLAEDDARVLAGELDLAIRFLRPGDGVMEDYCAGRVTARLKDDVVIAAHSE